MIDKAEHGFVICWPPLKARLCVEGGGGFARLWKILYFHPHFARHPTTTTLVHKLVLGLLLKAVTLKTEFTLLTLVTNSH